MHDISGPAYEHGVGADTGYGLHADVDCVCVGGRVGASIGRPLFTGEDRRGVELHREEKKTEAERVKIPPAGLPTTTKKKAEVSGIIRVDKDVRNTLGLPVKRYKAVTQLSC